ncbi:hypothetical protein [Methanobrevibacter millerae]|uniref:DUF4325 domain-containing protein n=1 Tax=Methanobrevibacter millerae TaxID=230361 RepID=A0A1G5XBA6_9EURY|nr:hypothetical protein [Methanobrevibacter millerae]SDA67691.1 hypothetical protein SAMN02910315_02111 [Methanobrevibacter millerae]
MVLIKLKEEFGVDLGSRSYAVKLFENLKNSSSKTTIDFEGIEFVSRSFSQEYLNSRLMADFEMEEINVPDAVRKMFNVVLKNNDIDMRY